MILYFAITYRYYTIQCHEQYLYYHDKKKMPEPYLRLLTNYNAGKSKSTRYITIEKHFILTVISLLP